MMAEDPMQDVRPGVPDGPITVPRPPLNDVEMTATTAGNGGPHPAEAMETDPLPPTSLAPQLASTQPPPLEASTSPEVLRKELDDLAAQKSAIASSLPSLWRAQYGHSLPPAAAPETTLPLPPLPPRTTRRGGVQGPSLASGGAVDMDRIEDIWQACFHIIEKELWPHKSAGPFQQPVDPIALGIPDYPNIIKHPMDLRTIYEKLGSRGYFTPLEFRDDIRLVWSNCAKFNLASSPVSEPWKPCPTSNDLSNQSLLLSLLAHSPLCLRFGSWVMPFPTCLNGYGLKVI